MRVNFNPVEHGFAFPNSFTNHVVKIPALGIDITTAGRCGGMAAASLDYWRAGLAVPTESALPEDGTLLGDYLYARLIDTLFDNGPKFVQFMSSLDHSTWLRGMGVARTTREVELVRLRRSLEQGQPCLLGLCQARSVDQLGDDHQVLAYGYETDSRYTYVLVYDSNDPKREIRIRLTTRDDPRERELVGSNGKRWRGLFVESYSPRHPSFLANGRLLHDADDPRIYVVRRGGRFWVPSPAEFDASGFTWDKVVAAKSGSMAHVATHPGNSTLVRERGTAPIYVVYGGKPFHIPSPAVFEAMGSDWNAVQEIPRGSLGGLRSVPSERTLLRELSAAPVYVVQEGRLRHVTSPAAMAKHAYHWSAVGIVPDGSLAGLQKGQPVY